MANLPWMLSHGIHSQASALKDPAFRRIGNPELIERRVARQVPVEPFGTLADYVPFYLTPRSPMLLNIRTGYNGIPQFPMSELAIVVLDLKRLANLGREFLITDRHAYLAAAVFSRGLDGLDTIDWAILQASDFSRSSDDPGKTERYQAEVLVHQHVGMDAIRGLVCYDDDSAEKLRSEVQERQVTLPVAVKAGWYFS